MLLGALGGRSGSRLIPGGRRVSGEYRAGITATPCLIAAGFPQLLLIMTSQRVLHESKINPLRQARREVDKKMEIRTRYAIHIPQTDRRSVGRRPDIGAYTYNMKKQHKVFKLQGKVQHYAWGGAAYLPQLLHLENPDNKPFAEYWMGAHDNAPAELVEEDGSKLALNEYIRQHPQDSLIGHLATAGSGVHPPAHSGSGPCWRFSSF